MSDNLDFLAELDAEIAAVASKTKLESDKKKLLAKSKNRNLAWEEVLRLRAELAEVDKILDSIVWTPISAVAFFVQQDCDACGSTHRLFLQHMEKQSTGKANPTTRWTRVKRPNSDLPTEVVIQQSKTHICADCCEDFGFHFPSAEIKFISTEAPFTISPTYEQEDLNAEA